MSTAPEVSGPEARHVHFREGAEQIPAPGFGVKSAERIDINPVSPVRWCGVNEFIEPH